MFARRAGEKAPFRKLTGGPAPIDANAFARRAWRGYCQSRPQLRYGPAPKRT
jgi:hypothetical protein